SIADFDNDADRDLFHVTESLEAFYNGTRATSFAVYPAYRERVNESSYRLRDPRDLGFERDDSRSVVRLDYDRDGYLDLAVGVFTEGDYPLYRNTGAGSNWFEVRVRPWAEQTAIGSEVTVTTESGNTYHRRLTARTDFLSQESRVLHFGLGDERVASLTVEWPDGTTRTYEDLDTNARVVVTRDGATEV
ncbi:MAG: ASPIC/UnbV domain-containing protein, partial [Halobacteriaceae archaeon]